MSLFVRVGEGTTSIVSNTQRARIVARPYVDARGYIQNAAITFHPVPLLERGPLEGPLAIVLHRTVSSTASSTLNAFQRGVGTHFLIAKDGTIYQCASLERKTAHVGPIRARCLEDGSCDASEAAAVARMSPMAGHRHEKVKPYPRRFPMNEDSVGIETVAMYFEDREEWEAPTEAQRRSITALVQLLQRLYSLTDEDVYEHERISRKTAGEGAGLYDGTERLPARFPPPAF